MTAAPADSGASRLAMIPWMWNSGITASDRSCCGQLERRGDVAGRAGEVALPQWHDLGPRRRARRVQHQRLVVGSAAGRTWSRVLVAPAGTTSSTAPPSLRTSIAIVVSGAAARAAGAEPSNAEQRRGVEVVEVEPELVLAVLRVERCRAADRHRRQQHERHLGAVGEHDRDPVARAEAERAQLAGEPIDLANAASDGRRRFR